MLIVTGPGRSGTSVLAQFCQQIGYDPGGEWCVEVNAGLEHPRVVQINDAILKEVKEKGHANSTLARYGQEMRDLNLAVIKDPRFTFHPALLAVWHSVRSDMCVLLTYRKPEHSLASRKQHKKFLMHGDKTRADVFRKDFANSVETLLERQIPFQMLLFPHFLGQYDIVADRLQTLGLEFDVEEGRQVWSALVDNSKVHFPAVPVFSTNATAQDDRPTIRRTSRSANTGGFRQQMSALCHRFLSF